MGQEFAKNVACRQMSGRRMDLTQRACARVRSTSSLKPMAYDSYGAKKHGNGERCANRISLCPPFSKSHAVCGSVAQNIPLRQQFTVRCLTEDSRFPEVLTCDAMFERVRYFRGHVDARRRPSSSLVPPHGAKDFPNEHSNGGLIIRRNVNADMSE